MSAAAADATSEGDWDAGVLAGLDVPVLQGLCLTSSRAQWEASNAALAPIDSAMQVAIPEFDGRLVGFGGVKRLYVLRGHQAQYLVRRKLCRRRRGCAGAQEKACYGDYP